MGIFVNQDDDALGLIRHLNEQTSSAFLEAEEILSIDPAKDPLLKINQTSPNVKDMVAEDESSCKENMFSLDGNFGAESISPFPTCFSVCYRYYTAHCMVYLCSEYCSVCIQFSLKLILFLLRAKKA